MKKSKKRYRARILSQPLTCFGFFDTLKFYSNRNVLKLKYELAMLELEERMPILYKTLTFIGFPKPY